MSKVALPNGWKEVKFSTLFKARSVYTDDLSTYPLFSLTIENGVTKKTDRYERSHLVLKDNAYKVVHPNDFVYNPMNVIIGAAARYFGENKVSVSGYYDIFFAPIETDNFFFDNFLTSHTMQRQYHKVATGSLIEKQRVHFSQFMDFVLPLPPAEERHCIAEILTTQDRFIDAKTRLINEKNRQKRWLAQKLLLGSVRLSEFTESWNEIILRDICTIVGGGTPSTKMSEYWQGDVPWISSADVIENEIYTINPTRFITRDAIMNSATKLCPKGTILLISRVGVGKLAIAPYDVCTSQDFTNITNVDGDVAFFAQKLHLYFDKAKSKTQGTSIKGLTVEEIKGIRFSVPCLSEQVAIAERLTTADREIELLTRELEQQKLVKKYLMQQLLTGKKRVKGAVQ